MRNHLYPTELTASQGELIKDGIPWAKPGGRPRTLDMRKVSNALWYVGGGGSKWRRLPRAYPNWKRGYPYFRPWRDAGSWQRLPARRRARVRQQAGRHQPPTAGCWDRQSVKTTESEGGRGYDAGKPVKGRKRPILVATVGLLLGVGVTVASVQDRDGARLGVRRLRGVGKKRRLIGVEGAYREQLLAWGMAHGQFLLRPGLRTDAPKGFVVLPKRWLVERPWAQSISSAEQRLRSAAVEQRSNDFHRHDSLDAQTAYRCLTFSDSL
jgi:putative transposase